MKINEPKLWCWVIIDRTSVSFSTTTKLVYRFIYPFISNEYILAHMFLILCRSPCCLDMNFKLRLSPVYPYNVAKPEQDKSLAVSSLNFSTVQVFLPQSPWLLLVTFTPVYPMHSKPHRIYFSNCEIALLLISRRCSFIISIPCIFVCPM